MKRLLQYSVLCLLAFGLMPVQAAYEEGKHYQKLPPEIMQSELAKELQEKEKDKILVLEFFSYGCTWCYKIEPLIENFLKEHPKYVSFYRIPVEFQQSWGPLTKAFYTAKDLNVLSAIHEPLFEAVQTEQITTASPEVLRKFFVSKGVKKKEFESTFDSFNVENQQKWANEMTRAYRITAVPVVIVQGPSGAYITSVRMAGSDQDMFRVIDELIKMEWASKATKHK